MRNKKQPVKTQTISYKSYNHNASPNPQAAPTLHHHREKDSHSACLLGDLLEAPPAKPTVAFGSSISLCSGCRSQGSNDRSISATAQTETAHDAGM